jgi:hypothetical protein
MTLQNNYLENAASLISGNGGEVIEWGGFGDTDGQVSTSDNALTNEIGNRTAVTTSKSGTKITYDFSRPATDVVDTANGDTIEQIGLFTDETGNTLNIFFDVGEINHTTNFDINTSIDVEVQRGS